MIYVADRTNVGIYQRSQGGVNDGFADKQPTGFRLFPAYPNPFNAVTHISFELPYQSDVSLEVYDLSGRSITSIFSGSQTAGIHSVSWNAGNHPSGVYFIKMEANGLCAEQRVMLLK